MTAAASCSEVVSSSQSQECASSTVKQGSWPPDVPSLALLPDSSFVFWCVYMMLQRMHGLMCLEAVVMNAGMTVHI